MSNHVRRELRVHVGVNTTTGIRHYLWVQLYGDFYRLTVDPTGLRALGGTRRERSAFWRARLVDELAGRVEGFVQDGKLVAGRPQRPTLTDAGRYPPR